jgi:hypothetical protein
VPSRKTGEILHVRSIWCIMQVLLAGIDLPMWSINVSRAYRDGVRSEANSRGWGGACVGVYYWLAAE